MQDLKKSSEKEILKLKNIFKNIKKSKKDFGLLDMAKRYFLDSQYFFKNKKYVESFEAVVISWAYIDAGLRLKIFEIPKEFKNLFTID